MRSSVLTKPSCNRKIASPGTRPRAYFFTGNPLTTTMVWSRRGACAKACDAAAPRAPPFLALSSWKRWPSCMQRKACTLIVSRRRKKWERGRRAEAEELKPYALERVDQAKLQ